MRRLFLVLVLALSAETARAAIVYLKEGGQLEGAVVSSTDSEIVLDTSQGRVRIGLDKVQSVDYSQGPPAVSSPAPPEYPLVRWRRRAPQEERPFEPRQQMLSIDFGLNAPLNNVSLSGSAGGGSATDGDAGSLIGFQYLYLASPRVGLGLELHYYDRGVADSPNLLPSAESHVFGDTLLFLGVLKYSLSDRRQARPYVLLGAGAHQTTTIVDAHPLPGFAWPITQTTETRRLVDGSALGFAASARVGIDFGFADPAVFSLEAGWTGLSSADYQSTPQGRSLGISGVSGPVNYFTFAGRWGWSF
jgi:hypothetical protein